MAQDDRVPAPNSLSDSARLHPQELTSGRSSGQQDAPSATLRKERLPWTSSCLCFCSPPICHPPPLPFGTIQNAHFFSRSVPSSPGRQAGNRVEEAGLGSRAGRASLLNCQALRYGVIPLGPSLSAMGSICRNACSILPGPPVDQLIAPQP